MKGPTTTCVNTSLIVFIVYPMKQFIISILFVLCFLTGLPLNGQGNGHADEKPIDKLESYYQQANVALKAVSTLISDNRKEHQLYVNTSWANCIIMKHDGSIYSCNGRYSVLDNAIEVSIDGKSRMIRPGRIAGAIIDGRVFESISSQRFEDKSQAAFFEVLSKGSVNLYVSHVLKSRMQGSNALTLDVTGEKVYYMKEEYVYSMGNGIIKNIPSRKGFIKSLNQKNMHGENELKNLKWKKGSKEDLMIAFDKVNELNQ